ncbi:hypothetical protein IWW50_006483, partial [Coemansia erecta]
MDDESDDDVACADFDEADSVPDPESFVVSSSDMPETFSVGASETLFADASIFAPGNALFLLDDTADHLRGAGRAAECRTSDREAPGDASGHNSDAMDTGTSSADDGESEASSRSASSAGSRRASSASSSAAQRAGGAGQKQAPVHNESDDDEHSNMFYVDPNTLSSAAASGMYFDDGGFTRFLRMHVKRQQQQQQQQQQQHSAPASANPRVHAGSTVTASPIPAATARRSSSSHTGDRHHAFIPAPTAVSGGLLLDSDLLANPIGLSGATLGPFLAAGGGGQFQGFSPLVSQAQLAAAPNTNPLMLPGSGQGPIIDSDPITAAFYSAFGLGSAPPSIPLPPASAAAPSPAKHGLNPSAAAALASHLARQQLSTATAAPISGAGHQASIFGPLSASLPHQQHHQQQPEQQSQSAANHDAPQSLRRASSTHANPSSEALQMLYFSQLASKAAATAAEGSSSALPRAATLADVTASSSMYGLARESVPRTIDPSAIDLPSSEQQRNSADHVMLALKRSR